MTFTEWLLSSPSVWLPLALIGIVGFCVIYMALGEGKG